MESKLILHFFRFSAPLYTLYPRRLVHFDMVNMLFSILPQIIERLEIQDKELLQLLQPVLDKCKRERDEICTETLGLPLKDGKQMLLSIIGGGQPSLNNLATMHS